MLPKSRDNIKIEIVVGVCLFFLAYIFALIFNLSERVYSYFSLYEKYNLNEVFVATSITGSLGLAYSFFRMKKMSREIARRIEVEKNVYWILSHDTVTELPNQKFLDSYILRSAEDTNEINCVIFNIEINRFKDMNALLDYENRNEIFKLVAQRLLNMFPENVYKLTGNEFLVLRSNNEKIDLVSLGGRILRNICIPININGFTLNIAANVGFSRYPEDSVDLRQVIQQSICARHIAKKAGRNEVKAFIPAMQDELLATAQIKADFKKALESKAISLYYQPLVDLKTQKTVGFEALARWEIAPGKFIPPNIFIPLAEDLGKIPELTEQLFRMACLDALGWSAHVKLSFNLSPLLFVNKLLGIKILSIMDELGFPADRLEVEITESAIFQNENAARYSLQQLRDQGVRIALDDFGTGYSSLSQLCNFSFDTLKIDKSFIDTIPQNEKQDKIVRSIISLADSLGVKVTAEGIEYTSQLVRLQDLGCDIGQGYLLGKPAPKARLYDIVSLPVFDFFAKEDEIEKV